MQLKYLIKFFLLFTTISLLSATSKIEITEKNTQVSSHPITVAEEFLENSSQEIACDTLQKPRSIQYIPDINIIKNSILEFRFTNCAIKQNAGQLYLVDKDGNKKAILMLYQTDENGNYISATFYFNKTVINDNDKNLFLSTQYSTDTQIKIPKAPTIVVKEELKQNDKVTMEVSQAYLMSGLELPHLTTESKEIIDIVQGVAGYIKTAAYSRIDIANNRVKFIPNSTTTEQNSTASGIKLTSLAEIGFTFDSSEMYDIIIQKDYECLEVEDKEDAIVLKPAKPAPLEFITSGCYWRWKGDFSDATGKALISGGLEAIIQSTGKDVIKAGDWTTSVKIKSYKAPLFGKSFTVIDKKTSHNWELDGEKFKIPYMNTHPKYSTYLMMTNHHDKDSEVYVDIYADKGQNSGQTQSAMACENVRLADLPANSTAMYFSSDIQNAINTTLGCSKFSDTHHRYMGIFLVTAPKSTIDVTAFQKDGAHGKRSVPVLTDRTTHIWGK